MPWTEGPARVAVLAVAVATACSSFGGNGDGNDGGPTVAPEAGTSNGATPDGSSATPDGSQLPLDGGRAYRDEVLADNPRAYWRLGETIGPEAVDESPNRLAAAYEGSCTRGAPGLLSTTTDTSLSMSASCRVPAPRGIDFAGRAPFTLEAWARPVDTAPTQCLLCKRSGSHETVLLIANGNLIFRRKVAGVPQFLQLQVGGGGAFYVAATYDGTTLRLFHNGARRGNTLDEREQIAMPDVSLFLGASDADDVFGGQLDEVAVYDHALSEEAIARHFAAAGGVR